MLWGDTRYRYDANGQVAQARFGQGLSEEFTEGFEYDAAKNVVGVRLEGPEVGTGLAGLLDWRSTPGGVVQLARGPHGERIALTHDGCGRVVERRVDRKGFRPKTWAYGWDVHDRLVSCVTPEGDTWFYRYDPFGRRLTKVRKLREEELAWAARKFSALLPAQARAQTVYWTWPQAPPGARDDDPRPPVVGTHFTWDGDVVAEEARLRLDGGVDWDAATRWHFEPDTFRPLAKQMPDGTLLPIVTDHLGTPREMFDEAGNLRWAASFTTWGVVREVRTLPEQANENGRGRTALHPRGPKVESLALKTLQDTAYGDLIDNIPAGVPNENARCACPIRFQGQWSDDENGLHYNFSRYFDPLSSQYACVDPIALRGGFRLHAYVATPSIANDPLGLFQTVEGVNIGKGTPREQGSMYEQAIRDKFGSGANKPTQTEYGQPDDLIRNSRGQPTNIEAKHISVWARSAYNPAYAKGKPWNQYQSIVQQLKKYSAAPGGTNIYTNSRN